MGGTCSLHHYDDDASYARCTPGLLQADSRLQERVRGKTTSTKRIFDTDGRIGESVVPLPLPWLLQLLLPLLSSLYSFLDMVISLFRGARYHPMVDHASFFSLGAFAELRLAASRCCCRCCLYFFGGARVPVAVVNLRRVTLTAPDGDGLAVGGCAALSAGRGHPFHPPHQRRRAGAGLQDAGVPVRPYHAGASAPAQRRDGDVDRVFSPLSAVSL